MSPYRENNTLKVTVLGLPPLTKGYYRFSLQPIDDHGRPTGQKSWEKVIPAESIQKGRTAQTLSLPGYALNFEVAYRLFVEKVTPNQGDAVDSLGEQPASALGLGNLREHADPHLLGAAGRTGVRAGFGDSPRALPPAAAEPFGGVPCPGVALPAAAAGAGLPGGVRAGELAC